jgi:two-component system chemotaxis response regulator CheB
VKIDRTISKRKIEAVVIGASAGGIRALLTILPRLPVGFTLPIVVVLHMPDMFDSKLAEIFQHHIKIPARQAQDKQQIKSGHLYFASPGYHLSIENDRTFSLSCEEPVHFSRPAIDILMSSAADAYRSNLAGFLLTGASADGAEGLARIKEVGGFTVVQDPQEAEISLMPQAAINLRQPNLILTLEDMSALLIYFGEN